ncbi:cytochrome c-type biogenesis protein [Algicella marina]|uniref:Cytochrome c-type biogenesis protein n=1 Tax=Algicella marina TaxID=2683284 RepID=A0A6P1SXX7_9RHOB|nr:cytochrome c-type biogenesis protein [Algicella marina]QHQ34490.1 cytochrome C biogenesis protein CcdA [Algicella marina]
MIRALFLMVLLLATPALAVEPDEVLNDPALETRARELSKEIRCLVCRNESIDDSSADLAKDLRILVRERLTAGDSDAEILSFLTDRYGEFVLLRPRFTGATVLLWLTGPILLLIGAIAALAFIRTRSAPHSPEPLSAEEQAQLDKLLNG